MGNIQDNIAKKKAAQAAGAQVGTASTEVILGSAARQLKAATTSIQTQLTTIVSTAENVVKELDERANELVLQVAAGEEKLVELKAQTAEEKRRNKLEVELAYKADEASAATAYAYSNNKVIVDRSVYDREKQAANDLQTSFDEKVEAGIKAGTEVLETKHFFELEKAHNEYEKKEAVNLATITQLSTTNTELRTTIEQMRIDRDKDRQAEVSRNEALRGLVQVNGTKNN